MFVEFHVIQNFGPSCLNRDDTGAPKSCMFGGVRRARVSSQCFKRSTRRSEAFREAVSEQMGVRTRHLGDVILQHVSDHPADVGTKRAVVDQVLSGLDLKLDKDGRTAVLLFLSPLEIDALAQAVAREFDGMVDHVRAEAGKKKPKPIELDSAIKGVLSHRTRTADAVDIALFGRMVSELKNMNVDAACQMAHALSTHAVSPEIDFYTALDDLQSRGSSGAAMMGVVEFNSACFYRYAVVDCGQLLENLDGNAELMVRATTAFGQGYVAALPTGRQGPMAAHDPPSFVRIRVRGAGQPVSLANAFVNPVRVTADEPDLIARSVQALLKHDAALRQMYGADHILFDQSASCVAVDGLERVPLPTIWNGLAEVLSTRATS